MKGGEYSAPSNILSSIHFGLAWLPQNLNSSVTNSFISLSSVLLLSHTNTHRTRSEIIMSIERICSLEILCGGQEQVLTTMDQIARRFPKNSIQSTPRCCKFRAVFC
ncbi:hypothetical protein L6452_19366 [Arctium lappa]|uniref:Uncharacterized protein n=1 Tax=Arctium lappa TaxID=4217 RepID=A0ACB9B7P1_ARCLA|nr:hypothetical protein L6452_19366 [Arctium lappa]